MDNDGRNQERPKNRFFQDDGQMGFHWGADKDIMDIIRYRDSSPETQRLIDRRIFLAKPGQMRPQWNRELKRDIYVPRRPENAERKEIKESM